MGGTDRIGVGKEAGKLVDWLLQGSRHRLAGPEVGLGGLELEAAGN